MKKVLVTYITHSGTTRDVAEAIAEEITKTGFGAQVMELGSVKNTNDFDAVVLGAPMIIGWHRNALKYLKSHKAELVSKPLALFLTAMSLTESPRPKMPGVDLHTDHTLIVPPQKPGHIGFKESFTTLKHYLTPVLKAAPTSLKALAFFGGRLDMYRLKWYDALFVMLVVGAKPGEKRNWPDIRAWGASLPALLKLDE
ncbi:MAG: flavodoxin domain-containing protein [Anaerolineaceae bacterium]